VSGKNNKGWLRVVEACVALIILIGFTSLIINQTKIQETNMQEKVNGFVLKIEKNEIVRNMILNDNCDDVKNHIKNNIIKGYGFDFEFESCVHETLPDKDVFTSSILMTSADKTIKFTLYLWK
jgi:hypothetical protein